MRAREKDRNRLTRTTTVDSYGTFAFKLERRPLVFLPLTPSLSLSLFWSQCSTMTLFRSFSLLLVAHLRPGNCTLSTRLQGTPVRILAAAFVRLPAKRSCRVSSSSSSLSLSTRWQAISSANKRARIHGRPRSAGLRSSRIASAARLLGTLSLAEGRPFVFRAGIHCQCPLLTTEELRAPTPGRRAPIVPTSAGAILSRYSFRLVYSLMLENLICTALCSARSL